MKKVKIALIITALVSCASATVNASFAQSSLESKIQLKSPSAMTRNAGQNSFSNPSDIENNPLVNGYMGAMGNMLNNSLNTPYNIQEQQKQQAEYVKQKSEKLDN